MNIKTVVCGDGGTGTHSRRGEEAGCRDCPTGRGRCSNMGTLCGGKGGTKGGEKALSALILWW